MKKRNLLMIVVSLVLVMALVGCGNESTENTNDTVVENTQEQESVVEDVKDTQEPEGVIEGDAPIDDDVDSGLSGESLDLSNTTVLNVAEKFGTSIELPVFTFAYFEDTTYYGYYKANNISEDDVINEVYSLKIGSKKKGVDATEAYNFISEKYNEMNASGKYSNVEVVGNNILVSTSNTTVNGTSLEIIDTYYVYDAASSNVYQIDVAISKNSALYGENVLEKSTADYREQLRDAVIALAN